MNNEALYFELSNNYQPQTLSAYRVEGSQKYQYWMDFF